MSGSCLRASCMGVKKPFCLMGHHPLCIAIRISQQVLSCAGDNGVGNDLISKLLNMTEFLFVDWLFSNCIHFAHLETSQYTVNKVYWNTGTLLHLPNNVHCLNDQARDSVTQIGPMDPRNDLVSFFLLLIIAGDSADGLSTDKCSHDQLISAFRGFEKCMGIGHIPFFRVFFENYHYPCF